MVCAVEENSYDFHLFLLNSLCSDKILRVPVATNFKDFISDGGDL